MAKRLKTYLPPDRYFDPDPQQKSIAGGLYDQVADLPLICPHGHVDPTMFVDPNYSFGTPAQLFIIPDHYIFRMLYSQGIALEDLGVPRIDGGKTETDQRTIWKLFANHFYLFRGTPTGMWLAHELVDVFGIEDKLTPDSADDIYDQVTEKLAAPEFRPRALFDSFNIEVLATTDAATDTLEYHKSINESDWEANIIPTFRPDAVVNLDTEGWVDNIKLLSERSGIDVKDYKTFIQALENRREFFKSMGAKATDHAALTAYTAPLTDAESDAIFQQALKGQFTDDDATAFRGHMLMEMARMSTEDGLVMQIHVGSYRNHNADVFTGFGRDKGADIPIQSEFTRNLSPLLSTYGTNKDFSLILFTLDETTYARELAPLAGHYPAVKLGPPLVVP